MVLNMEYMIFDHMGSNVTGLLETLEWNSSNIKFTVEVEENKSLPFLNILTRRRGNGTVDHDV